MEKIMKVISAGIVAFIILNILLIPYNTTPVHVDNEGGNTDYVWPANSVYMRMTEGISHGRYDDNGFNNLAVIENPDVIILGSSHMEAANVNTDQTTASCFNEMQDQYKAYNMGISGHEISRVLKYLEKSIAMFEVTPKFVVIETWSLDIDVDGVLDGTIKKIKSNESGLLYYLQKLPFLRTIYFQLDQGLLTKLLTGKNTNNGYSVNEDIDLEKYSKDYETILSYLDSIEEKYNTNIIILYHFNESINEDGSLSFNKAQTEDIFEELSKKHSITYVDMADYFETMYEEDYIIPHGFVTGELGKGHLNKYGHQAFAHAINDCIEGMNQ